MFDLRVAYDGGDETQVRAGQREMAAWEREPFGCNAFEAGERTPVLFFRYLAFAGLKRLRQLPQDKGRTPTFEQWDATVDEVEVLTDDEAADPTQTGPSSED